MKCVATKLSIRGLILRRFCFAQFLWPQLLSGKLSRIGPFYTSELPGSMRFCESYLQQLDPFIALIAPLCQFASNCGH